MNIFEELNDELEAILATDNPTNTFKEEFVKAAKAMGAEIVDTRYSYESELCKIKINGNTSKLDKYLEKCCVDRMDYVTVYCKGLFRYQLPEKFEIYAVLEGEGLDPNELTSEFEWELEHITWTENKTIEQVALAVLQSIQDLLEDPEGFIDEPDWDEEAEKNEIDAYERAREEAAEYAFEMSREN